MKNIGIMTHNFPFSAHDRQNAGIFVADFSDELSNFHKVSVYCPEDAKRDSRFGEVNIKSFPVLKGKKLGDLKFWNPLDIVRFLLFFAGGILDLSKFIKKEKIDINIAMWAFPSGVFAYLAKKIYGVPYLTWCLGSDIYVYGKMPLIRNIVRKVLKSSEYIFADGVDIAKEAERLSGRKCIFVPSVTNTSFKPAVSTRKSNFISLAYVARMEHVKGPDIFLEALIKNKKDLSGFQVSFVGDGTLLSQLKSKVSQSGLNEKIKFYGNINNFQKIGEIISTSDWLVIPSLSDSIPLIFSESMKCKTPVIVSDLADLSFLVNKYKVGYLFKRGDFSDLARIIKSLPKRTVQRMTFVNNTNQAAKDFNLGSSVKNINSFLKKI